MLVAIHPELVHMERGEPGYTGDPQQAAGAIFGAGSTRSPRTGDRDPARSSAENASATGRGREDHARELG